MMQQTTTLAVKLSMNVAQDEVADLAQVARPISTRLIGDAALRQGVLLIRAEATDRRSCTARNPGRSLKNSL